MAMITGGANLKSNVRNTLLNLSVDLWKRSRERRMLLHRKPQS